jgi:hypothetical protein
MAALRARPCNGRKPESSAFAVPLFSTRFLRRMTRSVVLALACPYHGLAYQGRDRIIWGHC